MNGKIDLTDGVVVLNYLFLGADAPACMDAADTDDSGGELSLTDAVVIFNWLFLGKSPPKAPSPSDTNYAPGDCSVDPTPEGGMGCATVAEKCR